MMKFRRCLASVTAGVLLSTAPALALADDISPGEAGQAVGIAWDESAGHLFIADADAPGSVRIVDDSGAEIGEVSFTGEPESVQALALADGVLHVADIGDPQAQREFVTVFGLSPEDGQQGYRAWDFAYPDGAQDAAAFLISGRGRFYFITSGEDPGIYASQLGPSRDGVNALFRAADAPEGVTDAVFLDDGETMLVRTADGVELINAFSWETTDATTYSGAPQGESITQFGDGRMLVGAGGNFRDEPLPDGETNVTVTSSPSPTPTPTPTAESTESGTPSPDPTESAEPAPGEENVVSEVARGGTFLAIGGAALVAVLAGALVFFSRD